MTTTHQKHKKKDSLITVNGSLIDSDSGITLVNQNVSLMMGDNWVYFIKLNFKFIFDFVYKIITNLYKI